MNHKNLRCDETIGELAPSGISADGPECAAWLQDNARVMKVWHETSPVLPNEAKWDAVWTGLSAQLDQAELAASEEVANTFTMRRLIAGRRRKMALAGFVLAQAAVVMLVVSLGLREKVKETVPASTLGDVVVEAGGTTLIQKNGASVKAVVLAYDDPRTTVSTNYDLFNSIEAMANH